MYENCANNACFLLCGNVSIVRWCIISKRHQLGDAQYLGNCFGAEPTSNEIYEGFSASLYQDEILNEHIKLNLPAIRTGPNWLITCLLPLNKCEWRLQAETVSAAIELSHFVAHQTRHIKKRHITMALKITLLLHWVLTMACALKLYFNGAQNLCALITSPVLRNHLEGLRV